MCRSQGRSSRRRQSLRCCSHWSAAGHPSHTACSPSLRHRGASSALSCLHTWQICWTEGHKRESSWCSLKTEQGQEVSQLLPLLHLSHTQLEDSWPPAPAMCGGGDSERQGGSLVHLLWPRMWLRAGIGTQICLSQPPVSLTPSQDCLSVPHRLGAAFQLLLGLIDFSLLKH